MVKVYIWNTNLASRDTGHAALWISPNTYISWWPERPVGFDDHAHPHRMQSLQGDIQSEGRNPDETHEISVLNENAILDFWQGFGLQRGDQVFQGPLPSFHLVERNCSYVVGSALKAGGGNIFAAVPEYWDPQQVSEFAQNISRGAPRSRL